MSDTLNFSGETDLKVVFDGEMGLFTTVREGDLPYYTGATEITPTDQTQTLPTADTIVTSNITVNAIPEEYIDTTDATLNDASLLPSGVTAYADGVKYTGTAAINDDGDLVVSGDTVTVPAGFYEEPAAASVASGSATTPTTSITANPSISVGNDGSITASVSATQSVTPTVEAGYVSSGTAGTITVSGSGSSQLSTQAAATITPTTSSQTAVAAGKFTTGAVTVDPIPSEYIIPTGTKQITSNGTGIDVAAYADVDVNVSSAAISVVDTLDSHGGTIRTITGVDLSEHNGKVVQSGALVSQTSATYTTNNTYDTTTINSVTVNVSGASIKRGVIRPDAVLVESWGYDKLWIAEEHGTLPAYSTSAVTLKASEALTVTHEWDLDNYKYIVLVRSLVIPTYNVSTIARGRVEWSESNGAYELTCLEPNTIPSLVDPTKFITSRSITWLASGSFYKMPYYQNASGQLGLYAATSYGIWCNLTAPSYASGQLGINSPSFVLRCQANVFDQPFYEALDDIRFQWKIELWREPIGSLQYDGWTANQEFSHILDCLNSNDHTLT